MSVSNEGQRKVRSTKNTHTAQHDNGTLQPNTHARAQDEQCDNKALSGRALNNSAPPYERVHRQNKKGAARSRSVDNDDASARSTRAPQRRRRHCQSPFVKLRSDSSRHKKTTRPTRARIGSSRVESIAFACLRVVFLPCSLSPTDAQPLAQQTKPSNIHSTTTCATTDRSRARHYQKTSSPFTLCWGRRQRTRRHHTTHNIEHARSSPLQFSQYTREQNHDDAQRQHRQLVRRSNRQRCHCFIDSS